MSARLPAVALLLLTTALSAPAQWSSNPAANLSVADGSSDQNQPKLAPTPDGGCYVSWFDGIGSGYDVRLQKLDALGNELWAHNGVLVLDREFSSTQDYGLDTDSSGNALLAFRDDSGANVQITAAKVTSTGTLAWGAGGVQLTATTAFVAAPKIAGTSDGGAVVAWTQSSSTVVQKLSSGGVLLWSPEVTLTPGAGSYSASDLHDSGADAILSFVHQTGGFGSARRLYAQKLDSGGAFLWGGSHVAVFDGGSLQFGNFPRFAPDGSGGAVFSWYDTSSSQLQVYAQHVLANGTEAFPHNGSAGSTNATRVRVSPQAVHDSSSGTTFMAWVEQSSGQSQSGVYLQKFDASGNRQWGASGSELVPLSSNSISLALPVPGPGSPPVFWSSGSGGVDQVSGAAIDSAGGIALGPFDVATAASGKARLVATTSTHGASVVAWVDDRVDSGDVFVQNAHCDGTLGTTAGTNYCTAGTTASGCNASISGLGSPSASAGTGFLLTVAQMEGGKQGILFYGLSGPKAAPWGAGSSFLCVQAPVQRTLVQSSGGTNGACDGVMTLDWNAYIASKPSAQGNPFTGGEKVWAQGWFRDPPSPKTTSLSDGLEFTVCP